MNANQGKSHSRDFALLFDFDAERNSLVQRAITQWQFGDWTNLSRLDPKTFENPRDRALVAALCAVSHLQLGNETAALDCVKLAVASGCERRTLLMALLSGVHNTLGRTAAILGQEKRAQAHFTEAIALSPFACDQYLISAARMQHQFLQLGMSAPQLEDQAIEGQRAESSTVKVEQLAAFNLGDAWSANTVNTVIFRHHGVMTWDDFQYTAFYVDESTLRLVQRDLKSNHIKIHDLKGRYNLRDAHNSISLGADRQGHIHISYDHHATRLRYRRSKLPNSIAAWTDELPMTGINEDKVTYPTFILPRTGHPLTMLYRDGVHNKGSARIKTYDEESTCWADRPLPILSGAEQKPWTSNPYWNHPAIGSDGSLHLSFVWRTDMLGEGRLVNNINIGYAWSPDNGLNWFTSRGTPYRLPITQVNSETVWPVPPASNLINQTSMALDSLNRPHLAFYANDAHNIPQYQHVWFDGSQWNHEFFSRRTSPFVLRGGGTLRLPISRPEILVDSSDRIFAVFRGDVTDDLMCVTRLSGSLQTPPGEGALYSALWVEKLDSAEPVIDRTRWSQDNVLSLLLQRNQQPDGDVSHVPSVDPVWLVDLRLN